MPLRLKASNSSNEGETLGASNPVSQWSGCKPETTNELFQPFRLMSKTREYGSSTGRCPLF